MVYRVAAQACAPIALPGDGLVARGSMPGLLEPQYESILQIEKTRWGRWGCWEGEPNAQTARPNFRVVVVQSGVHGGGGGGGDGGGVVHDDDHDVGGQGGDHGGDHAAQEGVGGGGRNVAAGKIANRHAKGLVVVDNADRKSCGIHRGVVRQLGRHIGRWVGIRPLRNIARSRGLVALAERA